MSQNLESINSNIIDGDDENNKDIDDEEEEDEDFNPDNVEHSGGSEDEDDLNEECKDDKKDTLEKIDEDKVSSLWKEFCKDVSTKDEHKSAIGDDKKVVTVAKEYDFAGEIVVVNEQVSASKLNGTNNNNNGDNQSVSPSSSSNTNGNSSKKEPEKVTATTSTQGPIKRTAGGLSSLLGQLSKKPKMSTLTKSLHDWTDYKKKQQLEEELDQHRKSKGSFIDRQAFLSRTDLREFEREKAIRDHERRMRNLKPE